MMSTSNENREDIQTLVEQLTRAAECADKNDLSTLAKMHGWCEALLEATRPEGDNPSADQRIHDATACVAQNLEALILGEAAEPDQALACIVEAAARLNSGEASPAEPEAPANLDASPSDEEVADQLAKVFDDEASAADAPPDAAEADSAPDTTSPESGAADVDPPAPTPATESNSPPLYVQEPLLISEKEIEFVRGFVDEAREHLEAVEVAVLEVERAPTDSAKIDDLFRPFHTIKGMAGFLNLRDVNCLTHELETLLDQGRRGERTITADLIDLILEAVDVLKIQIDEISVYLTEPDGRQVVQPPVADMITKLRWVAAGQEIAPKAAAAPPPADSAPAEAASPSETSPKTESSKPAAAPPAQSAAQPSAPPVARQSASAGGGGGDQSVRIETAKLDALVDMVGELVIAQTLVGASPKISTDPKLSKDVGQVAKIVRDVQEVAMAMRMVPIGATFQRMARLVRDVSRKAGKTVELTISGEDTELDKNVIQQIGDPLVHMVRNAVDHGVEPPEDRVSAGKSEVGHVHLNASHHGGNIVIQVQDDGKGLDRDKLVAKAIEKGVIQPTDELTDEQAYALVFAPGFSTAAAVTDISGRGVGMDVVKRNIEQLRGRTEITSTLGRGSTFSICLPLTLAIIDGMIVQISGERFIIPTITIEQALRPRRENITTVQRKGELLKVREQLVPLIQLGELFGLGARVDPCQAMVVIAHSEGRRIGLVVSELIGQQQVVIKTLGERFKELKGVSGAAILGDGKVGLILEMTGLAEAHQNWQTPTIVAEHGGYGTPPGFADSEPVPDVSLEESDSAGSSPCDEDEHEAIAATAAV
ncbi:MAG: chemotaxis protein CheA [bacterium]|nr:chemotaxis protein CheA [bacterium]